MNEAFRLITPITYGLIVAIWSYIFILYFQKVYQNQKQDKLLNLLLTILIIDAFRTVLEGIYFGIRHASKEGFISEGIYDTLIRPEYVFLPKFITLITGVLVLVLVLYRWLPAELKQKLALKELIFRKNSELLLKNQELRQAKERVEESDRLKTEFLNNMSHEIRTPMNGIIGFSKLLDQPDISQEKKKHYSKIVQNSSYQLLRIIDDILEISNLETQQEKVKESKFCLNDFLMELYSILTLKHKQECKAIDFRISKALEDMESHITSDKARLNKILSILLENAFRYTQSGSIELGYTISNARLSFYVKDTGIGISADKHEQVFNRFSQEEKEISRSYGGLGLGLAIAKENAKLLGGDITLESKKGEGSTFTVNIPYKAHIITSYSRPKENINAAAATKSTAYTVLIAEDEEMNYLFLETLIQDYEETNYKVIHAKNGQEAVDMCKSKADIDIVLMDIKMPIMDGYEASRQIRAARPQLPIIAQSAYTTATDIDLALNAGCNDHIAKPTDKNMLFKLMNKHLS